jgi:hypothetical protein
MRVAPGRLGMAVGARLAEIPLMPVVVAMARDAFGSCLVKWRVDDVTVFAYHLEVTVTQWEISEPMVESCGIETDDVGGAALMVGMATRASIVARLGGEAVKSRARTQILSDLRMAIEAQVALLLALEADVTRRALPFVLGMARDDGPRHHEALEALQLCTRIHAN